VFALTHEKYSGNDDCILHTRSLDWHYLALVRKYDAKYSPNGHYPKD
jgi:hypothetical protein